MTSAPFPTPVPVPESVEFWEGCKRGELLIQQCDDCRRFRYYPRPACPYCSCENWSWHKASGKATLYSYIIIHPPTLPAFKEKVPYPVILVELEEGVRMVSNPMDIPNGELAIGTPLEIVFDKINDDVTLPKFRRAAA